MKSWIRRATQGGIAATMVAGVLTACSSSSGPPTLTWFINPDNGSQVILAKECTTAAHGKYKISTQILPTDASQQRQQLVTRLAAQDSSISMMSLDPVFIAEFAEAGFLSEVPGQYQAQAKQDIVKPAVQASTWKGKLMAVPFWANTQLLWYRKSLAQKAGLDMSKPVTWNQIISAAKSLHKTVGVQADQYEGYTVWINALIEGAGGKIVDNPGAIAKHLKLGLNTAAGKDAANIISQIVKSNVGGPALSTNEEPQALALFESPSTSAFLVNWPYSWAAMGPGTGNANVPFRDTDVGWAQYPQTVAGQPSRPPFGGIEVAISKYASHKSDVFDATMCITNAKHQTEYMVNSGNPSANSTSYTDPAVLKAFPKGLAATILSSLQAAAPRPQSQYYGDLSTALQESFSPPDAVNSGTPEKAQKFILQVLKGDKLL